jgi:probable rRNA maturation factor
MIVYEPPGNFELPRGSGIRKRKLAEFVAAVAAELPLRGEVSVLLAGDDAIRGLNRQFRNKNKPTDVLSFPAAKEFAEGEADMAGDVAVSVETALRQSQEAGHPLETELKILLLHGMLHLAGYDHETDDGTMRRREEKLRRRFDLPGGLITRNETPRTPSKARKRVTGNAAKALLPKATRGRRA